MKTILTGLSTLGVCTTARWYLDHTGRKPTEYAGGRVRLTALWNQGAAFDLPISRDVLFLFTGTAMAAFWAGRHRHPLGAGLILGGGASNLLERLRCHQVYDYIQLPKAVKPFNKYVYNLADFAILAGGIAWIIGSKKRRSN